MKAVLVDTSVWIDAFNGRKTIQAKRLDALLLQDELIITCPTVLQETLQGIKNDREYDNAKEKLSVLDVINLDPVDAAIEAAELFRYLRKKGITIRKSNDCLIAVHAIAYHVFLLERDRDFSLIAKHTRLKLFR